MKMAYGQWFHKLMSAMSWSKDLSAWNEIFSKSLISCPDGERAHREWLSFLGSDLATLLLQHGYSTLRELRIDLPKTVRGFESQRFGVIDLCFFDHPNDRCWLVDWKTTKDFDQMHPSGMSSYFKKLWCYKEAVAQSLNITVFPSLYFSSNAKWVTSSELMPQEQKG